jgi:PAS domain S-box-containing protein
MATHTTTAPPAATPAAPQLTAAARLAARAVNAPVAAVYRGGVLHVHAFSALADAERDALAGLCERASASAEPVVVCERPDATDGIAAFAAVRLEGGCIAAADVRPRGWSEADRAALEDAAALLPSPRPGSPSPTASRQGISVFRAMFEGSVSGLAVLDPGGRILRANRALARMLDVRAGRLFGRPLTAFLRGDGGEVAQIGQAVEHGRDADVHDGLRLRARGGRETWVRVKLTMRTRDGRPVFMLALVEDVSDRRRAAEALARRAAVLELMQGVSAAANRAGSLHEVLREALDLTCGYTGWPVGHVFVRDPGGTLVSSGIWRLDDPERYAELRTATEGLRLDAGEGLAGRVAATGAPVWIQDVQRETGFLRAGAAARVGVRGAVAWPVRAEGEVVAVAEFFSGHPEHPDPELLELLGNLGTQLGLVVERERILQRQREGEARLFQILEALPMGVVVRDAQGHLYYANRTAQEVVGGGPDHRLDLAEGPPTYAMFVTGTEEPYPLDRHPVLRAYRGEAAWVDDLELRPPGRRIPLRVGAAPIFGADGGVEYVAGSFTDLTDRVRMEQALREHARELERSNRELEEFAYVASHDLQEPLRKIRSFGDRLRERWGGELGEDGRDYLARMQAAAGRMQQLIHDLLQYSRVGRQRAQAVPVELGAVLREVLGDLEPRLRDTGGTVDAGPLAPVCSDPVQIRQLLQNLVANALKFHRPGVAPHVTVRADEVEGGRTVRLTVADNGIGFEPEHAERIFLPFQRLHGRSEYEGTGMGLAICRRIAESAGGSIAAHAAPGQGATFTVTLPGCAGRGEAP